MASDFPHNRWGFDTNAFLFTGLRMNHNEHLQDCQKGLNQQNLPQHPIALLNFTPSDFTQFRQHIGESAPPSGKASILQISSPRSRRPPHSPCSVPERPQTPTPSTSSESSATAATASPSTSSVTATSRPTTTRPNISSLRSRASPVPSHHCWPSSRSPLRAHPSWKR